VKLRFTPAGERQVLAVIAHLLTDRPAAARRFYERATKVLRRLEDFPESGRVVPEFPDLPFREVIIRPYRFFYRIGARTVWVVGVWHGAQLPGGPLDPNGA
jgi:plasmid stabilization system protein ParE